MIAFHHRLNRLEMEVAASKTPSPPQWHDEAEDFRETFGLPVPADTPQAKLTEGVIVLQRCIQSGDFADFIKWRSSCSDNFNP